MTPEEAIRTAIGYEKKVQAIYDEAVVQAKDVKAKKFFQLMADEEKSHVDFLEHALAVWQEKGVIDAAEMSTAIPSAEHIARGVARLKEQFAATVQDEAFGSELAALRRAFDAETETSAFYQKMVSELHEDARGLFHRFMEIEEGHKAIVEAELDAVENNGFWFDMQEFNQELNGD